MLALAVAISFLVSAVLNRLSPAVEAWLNRTLPRQQADRLTPDDCPIDLGDADTIVLGMGRVGTATVERLHAAHGRRAVGVEHDPVRVEQLREQGYRVVEADATDIDFWQRVQRSGRVGLVVLAMPFQGDNVQVLELLRGNGFTGRVAAIAQRATDVEELRAYGADAAFNLYGSAGESLADHAAEPTEPGPAVRSE
ncbi:NAD(P)-binding protein [Saccharomonospora sp. CUA-673]|uniref:NAD(P)-binding protein n=1 Tax=Saccharomonospora sp. CUA-673 TaxID=1904969 RepID=UPI001C9E423A|nr:NAD(P)-binding protein [Saccharomonospora sp. CUA-673]